MGSVTHPFSCLSKKVFFENFGEIDLRHKIVASAKLNGFPIFGAGFKNNLPLFKLPMWSSDADIKIRIDIEELFSYRAFLFPEYHENEE